VLLFFFFFFFFGVLLAAPGSSDQRHAALEQSGCRLPRAVGSKKAVGLHQASPGLTLGACPGGEIPMMASDRSGQGHQHRWALIYLVPYPATSNFGPCRDTEVWLLYGWLSLPEEFGTSMPSGRMETWLSAGQTSDRGGSRGQREGRGRWPANFAVTLHKQVLCATICEVAGLDEFSAQGGRPQYCSPAMGRVRDNMACTCQSLSSTNLTPRALCSSLLANLFGAIPLIHSRHSAPPSCSLRRERSQNHH